MAALMLSYMAVSARKNGPRSCEMASEGSPPFWAPVRSQADIVINKQVAVICRASSRFFISADLTIALAHILITPLFVRHTFVYLQ
jgi:hypothetical protein